MPKRLNFNCASVGDEPRDIHVDRHARKNAHPPSGHHRGSGVDHKPWSSDAGLVRVPIYFFLALTIAKRPASEEIHGGLVLRLCAGRLRLVGDIRSRGVLMVWVQTVRKRRLLSRIVGWLTIYAFALNTILTTAVATQMVAGMAADPFAICADGGGSSHRFPAGGGSHVDHQSCVICTTTSFAPPLPQAAETAAAIAAVTTAFRPPATFAAVTQSRRTPRTSQGPPQTV